MMDQTELLLILTQQVFCFTKQQTWYQCWRTWSKKDQMQTVCVSALSVFLDAELFC